MCTCSCEVAVRVTAVERSVVRGLSRVVLLTIVTVGLQSGVTGDRG